MKTIEMTETEYRGAVFGLDDEGRCLACGETAYGVEPDARKHTCEDCGERAVYGLEECLMMGAVKFIDDE